MIFITYFGIKQLCFTMIDILGTIEYQFIIDEYQDL